MRLDRLQTELEALNESLRERWTKLTNADLAKAGGDLASLAYVVAKRYGIPLGRAKSEVQEFKMKVGTTISDAAHVVGEAASDLLREGANHASEAVKMGSQKASALWSEGREQAKEFGEQAQSFIRDRPLTSLAVAAGAGALLALLLRRMA